MTVVKVFHVDDEESCRLTLEQTFRKINQALKKFSTESFEYCSYETIWQAVKAITADVQHKKADNDGVSWMFFDVNISNFNAEPVTEISDSEHTTLQEFMLFLESRFENLEELKSLSDLNIINVLNGRKVETFRFSIDGILLESYAQWLAKKNSLQPPKTTFVTSSESSKLSNSDVLSKPAEREDVWGRVSQALNLEPDIKASIRNTLSPTARIVPPKPSTTPIPNG